MTPSQATDKLLRHRVRLEGVARSEMRIFYQAMKSVLDSVETKLIRAQSGPWRDVTDIQHRLWKQRLDSAYGQVLELTQDMEKQMFGEIKKRSVEIARAEAGVLEATWANVDGISLGGIRITSELVDAAINTPVGGELLEDYVTRSFQNEAWRIKKAIQQAAVSGEGPAKAARLMRADIEKMGKRDAMTLARTHLNTISNRVNEEFLVKNDVDRVMYIDTLDDRTCLECAAQSGKIYDRNDPSRPPTPLHPNCRCLYVPYVEGLEPREKNYEQWLKTQPEKFQRETLGPKRLEAWQKGAPITGMVYEGKVRTVKELAAIYD